MERHFTATTYILKRDQVLLHKHPKFQKWMPPGGHVEENETPSDAAIREALEETGLHIALLEGNSPTFSFSNAQTMPKPFLFLIEDVPEYKGKKAHQHMDFIYLAKSLRGTLSPEFQWFTKEEIQRMPKSDFFEDTLFILEEILPSTISSHA